METNNTRKPMSKGMKIGIIIGIAVAAILCTYLVVRFVFGVHTHDFSEPTCTSPGVCSICGESGKKYAEHKFKEPNFIVCGETKAVCSVCGMAGDILDHKFPDDAACGTKERCLRCGKSIEIPHEPSTKECGAKATCTLCGADLGNNPDHAFGPTSSVCENCNKDLPEEYKAGFTYIPDIKSEENINKMLSGDYISFDAVVKSITPKEIKVYNERISGYQLELIGGVFTGFDSEDSQRVYYFPSEDDYIPKTEDAVRVYGFMGTSGLCACWFEVTN